MFTPEFVFIFRVQPAHFNFFSGVGGKGGIVFTLPSLHPIYHSLCAHFDFQTVLVISSQLGLESPTVQKQISYYK